MNERGAHLVGYLTGHGAEALRGKARHDEVLVNGIFGYPLHIERDSYLFVLLAEYLDTPHLAYLAQAVGYHVGIVLQLTRRAFVTL